MKKTTDYKDYDRWSFLMDDDFVRWVKQPDPAADAHWQQVLQDHPEKAPLMEEARALLQYYRFEPAAIDPGTVEGIWQQVQYNYATHRAEETAVTKRFVIGRWWRYAAAVLLLVATAYYGYRYTTTREMVFATQAGEKRFITLPDGTGVALNQFSRLHYRKNWNSSNIREVTLQGEAYFDVQQAHDVRPFQVRCEKGMIQVLGTSFNVRAREQTLQIVLEQGAVQLVPDTRSAAPVIMRPGDMLVLDNGGLHRKKVQANWYTAWRNSRLQFRDAPLSEVFAFLTDTYGWKFTTNITLTNERFNGAAPADDPDLLLEKIATVYQLRITRNADSVSVQSRR